MSQSAVIPENIEELVNAYKGVGGLLPGLHGRIARLASQEAIKACAKRLGMFSKQGGKSGLVFNHAMEAELFQDYLIYMHRPRGISLVQQMRNRKPYPPDSGEQELLEGMVQARFSAFWIRELYPAGGFVVLDVIRGEQLFVLDQILPHQDAVGVLTAFRIFPFRNGWMHTGANMAFGKVEEDAGLQSLNRILNAQEERELNEENVRRWRAFLNEMD